MAVVIKVESLPGWSPPVRIAPPGAVIIGVIRHRIVVIFIPQVDLLARKKRVSIFHLTQRFDLFTQDFTSDSNPSSFLEEIGI